jgi:outer membrane protein TolC
MSKNWMTAKIFNLLFTVFLLISIHGSVWSAEESAPSSFSELMDAYVRDALLNNPSLAAADARVDGKLAALAEIRAAYRPSLDFNARYTRAQGGRTIDFPVGDLLNPVYSTLNDLLSAQGRGRPFGAIENQHINLLRSREQNTALRITQVIYDGRISAGKESAIALAASEKWASETLDRTLARELLQAYLGLLQAKSASDILHATADLATENLKVNQSLFRNGKITQDGVFRAETDLARVEQAQLDAANNVELAQRYVNFLRGTDMQASLPIVTPSATEITALQDVFSARVPGGTTQLGPLQQHALTARPELFQRLAGFELEFVGQRHTPRPLKQSKRCHERIGVQSAGRAALPAAGSRTRMARMEFATSLYCDGEKTRASGRRRISHC